MYHAIVRRKVRALFAAVSRGDAEPVLAGLAPRFEHAFIGRSSLGGARHSLAATRAWYARLYRLLPDIAFDLGRIFVAGPPWNTLIVAEWTETNSAGGVRTFTPGLHAVRLVWGKMTQITICPDTTGLEATLARLDAAGVAEARAASIED